MKLMEKLLLTGTILCLLTTAVTVRAEAENQTVKVLVSIANGAYEVKPRHMQKDREKILAIFKQALRARSIDAIGINENTEAIAKASRYSDALSHGQFWAERGRVGGWSHELHGMMQYFTEGVTKSGGNFVHEATISTNHILLVDSRTVEKHVLSGKGSAKASYPKKLTRPRDAKELDKLRDQAIEALASEIADQVHKIIKEDQKEEKEL